MFNNNLSIKKLYILIVMILSVFLSIVSCGKKLAVVELSEKNIVAYGKDESKEIIVSLNGYYIKDITSDDVIFEFNSDSKITKGTIKKISQSKFSFTIKSTDGTEENPSSFTMKLKGGNGHICEDTQYNIPVINDITVNTNNATVSCLKRYAKLEKKYDINLKYLPNLFSEKIVVRLQGYYVKKDGSFTTDSINYNEKAILTSTLPNLKISPNDLYISKDLQSISLKLMTHDASKIGEARLELSIKGDSIFKDEDCTVPVGSNLIVEEFDPAQISYVRVNE